MLPNNEEKPDLIFGPHPNPKKYFTDGPIVPLSYWNDGTSVEMIPRSREVMRVLWDVYYTGLKPDNRR